jgi:trehalose/maltose hydrolase-like predicted phosphorylase
VALRRRFEALVFDWDGTAVPDRRSDAAPVRDLIEQLCRWGMHVAIVSGTHVDNVDGQLRARPVGPGCLLLGLNRGSEIFVVDEGGPRLVERRTATPAEDRALDAAATRTVEMLAARGLRAEIVSQRLNRRKIDLIPEPAWRDPPKAEIDRLVAAVTERLSAVGIGGLTDAVTIAEAAARSSGLDNPRVTSDAKHVEIGLTDKADSARWLFSFVRRHGVGPGLVLLGGDEFGVLGGVPGSDSLMMVPEAARATVVSVGKEPAGVPNGVVALGGGPQRFEALLADQLARRHRAEVPLLDEDPEWIISVDVMERKRARAVEALLTLSDGQLGTRGSSLMVRATVPAVVLASGVYDGHGADTRLLECPIWQRVPPERDAHGLHQVLDLHTFLLQESYPGRSASRRVLRWSSLARPGTVALRADCPAGTTNTSPLLIAPHEYEPTEAGSTHQRAWMRIEATEGGVVTAASQRACPQPGGREVLERLGAYVTDPAEAPPTETALSRLAELDEAGFERLLEEHRCAWARRWDDAQISIAGDAGLQLSARFALAHLLASTPDSGEAAVGARGLTGTAYRGHVFWDTDVFVLPVLAATHPSAARAILEYRARRLPAARVAARAEGHLGARFPWESARSGRDVTPDQASDRRGHVVPIRTGGLEVHIVGCVAWAVAHYLDWTDDAAFAAGAGAELLIETARYWASRIRLSADGRGHLYGVIGPDEYHEPVDDNAFTNVLARWNLRRAASLESPAVAIEQRDRWRRLADALVDGYNPARGCYEQFTGFFDLEPVRIAEVAPRRPIAADLLLDTERVQQTQIIKQADVLMLHHLLPDEVVAGSLVPDLDFYEPRTAHGSSLSPGIHASLLARAGRLDEALALLELTARIDLDDITDTTAGGLHLGAMASVWHALIFGFLGTRPRADVLELDPHVPHQWGTLEVRLCYHGRRVTIRATPDQLTVTPEAPVVIAIAGHHYRADASGLVLERGAGQWHQRRHPHQEGRR